MGGNILDQDESQCRLLQLESPVLLTAEFQAMRAYMGDTVCTVDCTWPAADGEAVEDNALTTIASFVRTDPDRARKLLEGK